MKTSSLKRTIDKIIWISIFILGCILALSCAEEECSYISCEDTFELITDFENAELGATSDWQGIADSGVTIVSRNGTNVLQALDGSGASFAYTNTLFPSDLIAAGCQLQYDVEYFGDVNNATSASNSVIIYQGTINTGSNRAIFVLNSSSLINSGQAPVTIKVPLELAIGTALPSNSFGEWRLAGLAPPYTAVDVVLFNSIIQNISGLGFFLDSGGNPAERWWYDNFIFKQCCKIDGNINLKN